MEINFEELNNLGYSIENTAQFVDYTMYILYNKIVDKRIVIIDYHDKKEMYVRQ